MTTSTYVLERVMEEEGEPVAVIAFDGDIYLPFPATGEGEAAGALSAEERIRVNGELFFDLEQGRVIRVVTDADATLTKIESVDGEPVRREAQIRETSRYELAPP